jgi:cytochrome P450
MAIIFAGVVNTGITGECVPSTTHAFFFNSTFLKVCWALFKLGANPKWKERVVKEYNTLVANHTNTLATEPIHKRLALIPLNAWEDELPSVDLVIRETLRLTMYGPLLRRNVQKDIVVDGVTIKCGDFMAYPTFEPHMNPDIYSNPNTFDPDRYLEGREEDKKETFAYVAWGAGASDFDKL